MGTFSAALSSLIAAFFGMNLTSHIEGILYHTMLCHTLLTPPPRRYNECGQDKTYVPPRL
jgi:hypothetical protein